MEDDSEARSRIEKDLRAFSESIKEVEGKSTNAHVVELARMYASDARSYLEKDKLYTAFSCISYAHGLVDALRELAKER